MRGVAGASFYKAAKPGSKTPKISVRIPRVDFNPSKAVGDAFTHFARQAGLFRKLSDRLKNPPGRCTCRSRLRMTGRSAHRDALPGWKLRSTASNTSLT
jgi:hypothetical protein